MSSSDSKELISPNQFLLEKAALHQRQHEQRILGSETQYEHRSELDELNSTKASLAGALIDSLTQDFKEALLIYNNNLLSPSLLLILDQRQSDWTIRRGSRTLLLRPGKLSFEVQRFEGSSVSAIKYGFVFWGRTVSFEEGAVKIDTSTIATENIAWLLDDEEESAT